MADDSDSVASSGMMSEDEMFASSSSASAGTCQGQPEQPSTSGMEAEEKPSFTCRKMKLKDEKTCGVCGDKALGYNFNAITCESCKAFFRRNALKDKSMVCLFDNKCVVDLRTRRFCPACRIRKCYSIGMNRDMILDDSERRKRMSKVMANRARKGSSTMLTSPIAVQIKSEVDTTDSVMIPQESFHHITEVTRPPTPYGKPHGNSSDIIFKHVPKESLPTDRNMYHQLSSTDKCLLSDITEAYRSTLAAMPEMGPYSIEKEYQKASDLINHSEVVVRKLIMFVKHLEDFKHLTQEDQIAALKACVMNTLLLRSALFYNIEKDAWLTPKGEIPTSILKNATGFVSLHNNHVYYCRRVKSMALEDLNLYALLQALIIFDPAGFNVTGREFISSIQDRYIILLKHYLESVFSYDYAKDYYVSALDRLCDLKVLSEEHAKILLQVNPVDVEPLMLEVLNLK
ncbi:nuclear hormone receptor HR96 [Aplysia californica]|uniref:Nuclear hormone receptor HR96 n=1 Tax=Aplysia californica TaxID=6500 RepID=A0ABM0JA90_APLCA|nr:nuclear hormone receptor HR96 [Aplysia californica]